MPESMTQSVQIDHTSHRPSLRPSLRPISRLRAVPQKSLSSSLSTTALRLPPIDHISYSIPPHHGSPPKPKQPFLILLPSLSPLGHITHLFSVALSPWASVSAAALHPPLPLLALHSPPSPSDPLPHLYLDLDLGVPVSSPRASSRLWSSARRPLRALVLRDPWPGAPRGSNGCQLSCASTPSRHEWQ
jgi:hypothetical protein